jgi:bifunctional non-homologous end joining protein LigD
MVPFQLLIMPLDKYHEKRNFERTPEPQAEQAAGGPGRLYVIQKHAARRLHYDLRLELQGALKSWAVPKGPSLDPSQKRLAVQVEDHPLEYGFFEGTIPKGEYGGGTVMVWDRGSWEPEGDPVVSYDKGNFKFRLHGEKLKGSWALIRMEGRSNQKGKNWLLIKHKDTQARPGYVVDDQEEAHSVLTGRTMDGIASGEDSFLTPDPAAVQGAIRARMPARPGIHLAVPGREPPAGREWLHEIKYDGYRILCLKKGPVVRLITRSGKDWSEKFEEVVQAAGTLPLDQCILDGEIVVLEPDGKPDFQSLQNILRGEKSGRPGYYVFDILYGAGYDLTSVPLLERKTLLRRILQGVSLPLVYGDYIRGSGDLVFEHACRMGLEGIVSKKADSRYEQRRSRSWIKVKCVKRQEFIIAGYTEPSGSRRGFGALLLGYYDESGRLIYAGRVGTGFREQSLKDISEQLAPLERARSPFHDPPGGRESGKVHWVRPLLTAEVEFVDWTDDRLLRQASFKGLREDKAAREVVLEAQRNKNGEKGATRRKNRVAGVVLSNPERILYPEQGVTKLALASFYERIAGWILPHLVDRPLTLLRCPQGHQDECFYQKHLLDQIPDTLLEIPVREKEEERLYIAVRDLPGLISLVQLGVLEIHPWGSRRDRLERPDRMIFDLDPGPGTEPVQMVEVLQLLHAFLNELELVSFLKTSGGKGFHVVIPLDRRSGWDEVRGFARRVAEQMARALPGLIISVMDRSKRRQKIYVDYLRNSRGATTVAPYSTRARAGAPVSTPLRWEELAPELGPDQFSIENLLPRVTKPDSDPWAEFFDIRQSLTKQRKRRLGIEE